MTPREHLARAEHLLSVAEAADKATAGPWVMLNIAAASAHIAMAHAIEAGAFHPPEDYRGGGGRGDVVL